MQDSDDGGKGKRRASEVPTLESRVSYPYPPPSSPGGSVKVEFDFNGIDEEEDSPAADANEKSVELRRLSQGEATAVADSARREGFVGFVLEAWLWLQFVVVVMLFLWAMAKRGPKVVLEAERRGAHARGAGHSSG